MYLAHTKWLLPVREILDISLQEVALADSLDTPGQINISVFFMTQNDSKYLINQILLSPQNLCINDGVLNNYCGQMAFQYVYGWISPNTVVVLMWIGLMLHP
jgi:hypothetical protein